MDPTYKALTMRRRKQTNRKGFLPALMAGMAGVNLLSQLGQSLMRKSGARRGMYKGRTDFTGVKPGMLASVRRSGMRKKKHVKKRKTTTKRKGAFDRRSNHNKQFLKKLIRKSRFSRRKGDLDNDFLSEFGNIDVEPTRTKSYTRMAWDAIKRTLGKKEISKLGKEVGKKAFNYGVDKAETLINKMSEPQAKKVARTIIADSMMNGRNIQRKWNKNVYV